MKFFRMITLFVLVSFCLTGCWDREYLKDIQLAYSAGFDLTEEGKIKETVEIIIPPETEQATTRNEIHTSTGETMRSSSIEMRHKVRGNMRFTKNGFLLIGKKLAEHGLVPTLDVNYRDPSNPTSNVRVIISEQEAFDILNQKMVGELKIGEFITQKIISLEQLSVFFPSETLDTVFRSLKDPGQDFALPYLGQQGNEIFSKGVALFHDQYFSGALDANQSILLVLLKGQNGGNARFTKKIEGGYSDRTQGAVSINVSKKNVKRKFKVSVSEEGRIDVDLNLKLKAIVEEYTGKQSLKGEEITKINQELSEMLTKDAEDIIRELKRANCDIFGVGRNLIAYHNNVWKTKNWNEDYRKVQFHPKVEVEIVDTGILQ